MPILPAEGYDMYEQKQLSTKQINSEIVTITDLSDEKTTTKSFSTWCSTADQIHIIKKEMPMMYLKLRHDAAFFILYSTNIDMLS